MEILIGVAIPVIGAATIGLANYIRVRFGLFKTEESESEPPEKVVPESISPVLQVAELQKRLISLKGEQEDIERTLELVGQVAQQHKSSHQDMKGSDAEVLNGEDGDGTLD